MAGQAVNEYHAFCDCGGTFTYEEDGQRAWHTCKLKDVTFGEYNLTSPYRKVTHPDGHVSWFRDWIHRLPEQAGTVLVARKVA